MERDSKLLKERKLFRFNNEKRSIATTYNYKTQGKSESTNKSGEPG